MGRNIEKYNNYQKGYYLNNRKKLLKKASKYQIEHKEEHKLAMNKYRKNNKYKILKQNNKYKKNRFDSDINYRILNSLRIRIWHGLKNNIKSETTMKLIGCSIEQLKNHLEKRFTKDMSWNNYGSWHIDHIKPCASFDMNIEEQQKICFHFTNLQPLWAKDNLKKSNKIIEEN